MPELSIDIVARFAKFQDSLTKIGHDVESFKGKLEGAFKGAENVLKLGVGVFVGREIAQKIHEFSELILKSAEAMDQLGKAAERTGISVEELANLKFAASLEDVDFDTLIGGLDKFAKAIDGGSGAFHRLGLNAEEFRGNTQEGLEAVAEAFSHLEDGAAKTALVIQLFGRAGAALIPFLNQGKKGIEELKEAAVKLGVGLTPDQAQQARHFNDLLREEKAVIQGAQQSLTNFLLPALVNITEAFVSGAKEGNIFLGVLKAIGQVAKNTFFGVDQSFIDKQRSEIKQATEDLQVLLRNREHAQKLNEEFAKRGRTDERGFIRPPNLDKLDNEIRQKQVQLAGLVTGLNNALFPKGEEKGKVPAAFAGQSEFEKAQLRNRLELIKQEGEQQRQIEDLAFAHSEDSLDEHYARLLAITQKGLREQLRQVRIAEKSTRAEIEAADDEEQRKPLRARAEGLRGEAERLQGQLDFAPQINAKQHAAAAAAFRDSSEQIGIALLKETGRAQDAAIAENNLTKTLEEGEAIRRQFGDDSQQLKDFKRSRALLELRGKLTDTLADEADVAGELAIKEEAANNAYIRAGAGLQAEIKLFNELNKLKAESAEETLRLLKVEEDLILQTTQAGSAEREKQLTENARKVAAVERARAEVSPGALAPKRIELLDRGVQQALQEAQLQEQKLASQLAAGELTTQDALFKTEAIRQLAAESKLVATQTRLIFEDAFVSPFEDLINHVKTADEALKAFFNNIAQSFLHLISQDLSQRLFRSLFGTSSGGGGTDLLGSIFGFFTGGGGGGGGGAGTNFAQRGALGMVMTAEGPMHLSRYSAGGVARRPQLAMFGEGRLPEAYVPLPDGRSIPVSLKGFDSSMVTPAIPPTLAQTQRGPKGQQGGGGAVVLQIHPDAMHMTLRDWFEGELARQAATR